MADAIARRRGPARLPVTGPLAEFEHVVRDGLIAQGYAASSVREALGALRQLSMRMQARDVAVGDLSVGIIEDYEAERRRIVNRKIARRWLGAQSRVLRDTGVLKEDPAEPDTVAELLGGYRLFLVTLPTIP